MVMGTSKEPVLSDDGTEHLWYYTGCTVTHGVELSQKRMSIGLARWRLHRFLSLDAAAVVGDEVEAVVETVVLSVPGGRLEVNADILEDGYMQIEVFGEEQEEGPPVGFPRGASVPLSGDSLHHTVRWDGAGEVDLLPPGLVRLRIRWQRARLFAFCVVPATGRL
jgi:hypothetical protein